MASFLGRSNVNDMYINDDLVVGDDGQVNGNLTVGGTFRVTGQNSILDRLYINRLYGGAGGLNIYHNMLGMSGISIGINSSTAFDNIWGGSIYANNLRLNSASNFSSYGSIMPGTDSTYVLGNSSFKWSSAYITTGYTKYIDSVSGSLIINTGGIEPASDGALDIGATGKRWNDGYINNITAKALNVHNDSGATNMYISSGDNTPSLYLTDVEGASSNNGARFHYSHTANIVYLSFISGGSSTLVLGYTSSSIAPRVDVIPNVDNAYDLGSGSKRWNDIYATNGTIQTSDSRRKQNISNIDQSLAVNLINALTPRRYQYVNGSSGRYHTGLVSQELKVAMENLNMTPSNEAVWIEDQEDENHWQGIRYTELIGYLIANIQRLNSQVLQLQAIVTP